MFLDHPDFGYTPATLNNTYFIVFNWTNPIVGDLNFRKAVAHILNRDDIAAYASNIEATPETYGTFWGTAMEFFNRDIPIVPYDINKAKEYLAASAYNGETLELTANNPYCVRAAEMIVQQLSTIGINVEFRLLDSSGMLAHMANPGGQFTLAVHTASITSSAADIRVPLHSTAPNNRAQYNNPKVDELIDKAGTVTDRAARELVYREVQEIVAEDMPYISLFRIQRFYIHAKGIGGLEVSGDSAFINYRDIYLDLDA